MVWSVFGGIAVVIAMPLFVVIGTPFAAWVVRGWMRLKERELELRELELVHRLRESRSLPAWVDADDPRSLLAWVRADRELAGLEAARVVARR
jgi:hypothetical protein